MLTDFRQNTSTMVPRTRNREPASSARGSSANLSAEPVAPLPGQTPHPRQRRTRLGTWVGTLVLSLGLLAPVDARPPLPVAPSSGLPVVALRALPVQARQVHGQILQGGPFRYEKDGTVFGNRERLLPRQPRGFYREYTVPTPGVRHRGARRIVCGGQIVHLPETCFYTEDHYQSFREIDPRH